MGKNPHSSVNPQHAASKKLATNDEEDKKKKLASPPLTLTPELDQKMFECIVSPPHMLTRE
jgi:hypothetical protein